MSEKKKKKKKTSDEIHIPLGRGNDNKSWNNKAFLHALSTALPWASPFHRLITPDNSISCISGIGIASIIPLLSWSLSKSSWFSCGFFYWWGCFKSQNHIHLNKFGFLLATETSNYKTGQNLLLIWVPDRYTSFMLRFRWGWDNM